MAKTADRRLPARNCKRAIAEAKRLRPYFFGNFYTLAPVSVRPDDWCVLAVPSAGEGGRYGDGVPPRGFGRNRPDRELLEIDPASDYNVAVASDYRGPTITGMNGAELALLKLKIPQQPGSLTVEYKKIQPKK